MSESSTVLSMAVFEQVMRQYLNETSIGRVLNGFGILSADFYMYMERNPAAYDLYQKFKKYKVDKSMGYCEEIVSSDENPAKVRNILTFHQWRASKWHRESYSEHVEISISKSIDIKSAILEGKRRIIDATTHHLVDARPMCDLVSNVNEQLLETTEIKNNLSTGCEPKSPSKSDEDDIFS